MSHDTDPGAPASAPSPGGATNRIQVLHVAGPTCWWSWGYEATLNRIRAVYGDQVEIRLIVSSVYDDFGAWLERYGLDMDTYRQWAQEAEGTMQIPFATGLQRDWFPHDATPATHAAVAALRQDPDKGARFLREMLRRFNVETQDITQSDVIAAAAQAAGLDPGRLLEEMKDAAAMQHGIEAQWHGVRLGHALGFYSIAVTDGAGRTMLLDHAFDPKPVEAAIDHLSGGRLSKRSPPPALRYLREQGACSTMEVARVLGVPYEGAAAILRDLDAEGKVQRTELAGADHWTVTAR